PVARSGKRDTRTRHHCSVERDKDAERHRGGDKSGATRSGNFGESGNGGALAGGNLRGWKNVLNSRIGCHEQNPYDKQAADESNGQAAFGMAYFSGDHG